MPADGFVYTSFCNLVWNINTLTTGVFFSIFITNH
jgi:hypothetical protein